MNTVKMIFDSLFLTLKSIPVWVWLVFFTPILLIIIISLIKRQKVTQSGMKDIDLMSGPDFEHFLKSLFEKLEYKVTHVGTSYSDHKGDFGCDLILEKDDIRTAVQAKRNDSKSGIFGVREVIGAKDYYQCNKAMVVSNSYFTADALTQAKASGVELWDRDRLIDEINKVR